MDMQQDAEKKGRLVAQIDKSASMKGGILPVIKIIDLNTKKKWGISSL